MTLLVLTPATRTLWESLAVQTPQAQALRRVQALLGLDAGESLATVAQRVYVTRQTVAHGVKTFQERQALPVRERLAEGRHSGRPRRLPARIDPLLRAVLPQAPHALGSRSTVWTAPWLTQYLWDTHALRVSRQSGSLALARLDVRWKRRRYRLARRAATWRQAQGGSSGGGARVHGRSSFCLPQL